MRLLVAGNRVTASLIAMALGVGGLTVGYLDEIAPWPVSAALVCDPQPRVGPSVSVPPLNAAVIVERRQKLDFREM